jgi:D-aspartate ligase
MTDRWPHVVVLDPWSAGLAISRRMRRAGAQVTVLALPGEDWEAHSRGVTRIVRPLGPEGGGWVAALREVAEQCQDAVVIPATDRAAEFLIQVADELPPNLRMFERTGRGHRSLMDKTTAEAIARRAGVNVPWTVRLDQDTDVSAAVAGAPWPCVLKPTLSHEWRERYGEQRAFPVADADTVADLVARPLRDGIPMLLCQYVPGGDDAVEEAIVVRRADGSYPVQFGCRKLRQHPRGFGATGLGVSSTLPETMAMAQAVLDAADFVGVAGVETKLDDSTGQRWFLEVNVRVPGQWGLGDACGVQATERLVALMADRDVGPQPPLRAGVRFVAPRSDVDACREILREAPPRRRPGLFVELFRPYLGAGELGVFDPRDPGPALVWLTSVIRRRLMRVPRRVRSRVRA